MHVFTVEQGPATWKRGTSVPPPQKKMGRGPQHGMTWSKQILVRVHDAPDPRDGASGANNFCDPTTYAHTF